MDDLGAAAPYQPQLDPVRGGGLIGIGVGAIRAGGQGPSEMSECDLNMPIPDWVIEHPETLAVFQELEIDYCFGAKSLGFTCRHQGLDAEAVLAEVLSCLNGSRQEDGRK
jgi:hypothetical protein